MRGYGWVITECSTGDHLLNCADSWGPFDTIHSKGSILKNGKPFRLRDNDGNVRSAGFYLGPDDRMHKPLEDFGTGVLECTEIQYKSNAGNWETIRGPKNAQPD